MQSKTLFQSTVDRVVSISNLALKKKIAYLYTEDHKITGKHVTVNGKSMINLGSCSYLGLEMHPQIKLGAIEAINNYGTQFSSSRSYLSCGLYKEVEDHLALIFDNPNLIVAPSTSMGHLAVMPVIIGPNDLVIADHQAHYSMQFVMSVLTSHGTDVELLRHNDLAALEEKIIAKSNQYEKIWYIMDGVYSMYGDLAPVKEVYALMEKYDNLNVYVDDAHGMSWIGKNGSGYVLSQINQHERMVISTSLNKSFAAGGGLFLFPNAEMQHRVRMFGGHLMFSGPLQIGSLGAILASAKMHLSKEVIGLQEEYYTKVNYCQFLLKEHGLPVVGDDISPIFYIGLGLPCTGYNLLDRMLKQEGYIVNLGSFPAVPQNCTGLRFTINNHLSHEDIDRFVKLLSHHVPKALQEEGRTMQDVYLGFKKVQSFDWIKDKKEITV
jgi:7-keto-8-aminopelargonate synthetase-like enzyme